MHSIFIMFLMYFLDVNCNANVKKHFYFFFSFFPKEVYWQLIGGYCWFSSYLPKYLAVKDCQASLYWFTVQQVCNLLPSIHFTTGSTICRFLHKIFFLKKENKCPSFFKQTVTHSLLGSVSFSRVFDRRWNEQVFNTNRSMSQLVTESLMLVL